MNSHNPHTITGAVLLSEAIEQVLRKDYKHKTYTLSASDLEGIKLRIIVRYRKLMDEFQTTHD